MKQRYVILFTTCLCLASFGQAETNLGDDFNAPSIDPNKWGQGVQGSASDHLVQTNGVLQYVGTEMAFRPWVSSYGSYTNDWQVIADLNLGNIILTEDPTHVEVGFQVAKYNGTRGPYGLLGEHTGFSLCREDAGDTHHHFNFYSRTNWVTAPLGYDATGPATTSKHVSARIAFDAATKTLTAWYDEDGSANGYTWTPFRSVQVNAPQTDWSMGTDSLFAFGLLGSCENHIVTTNDNAYLDNFLLYGSVVPSPPLLDIIWTNGSPRLGISGLVNTRYAVEYVSVLAVSNNWQNVMTYTNVCLTNSPLSLVDQSSSGVTQRFYRARLVP